MGVAVYIEGKTLLHIIQSNSETLISNAYLEKYNSSPNKYHWLQFVKNILYDLGFGCRADLYHSGNDE